MCGQSKYDSFQKSIAITIMLNCDLIADSFIVKFLYRIFASNFFSSYCMKLPRNHQCAGKFLVFSLLLMVAGKYIT